MIWFTKKHSGSKKILPLSLLRVQRTVILKQQRPGRDRDEGEYNLTMGMLMTHPAHRLMRTSTGPATPVSAKEIAP